MQSGESLELVGTSGRVLGAALRSTAGAFKADGGAGANFKPIYVSIGHAVRVQPSPGLGPAPPR